MQQAHRLPERDTATRLLDAYRGMLRIRRVEEAIARRYSDWNMRCPVHLCIGQEAIAVGVSQALAANDLVYSNHRAHGHYLAKGGNLNALIAEMYGKADGCAGGWGGSMHLIDTDAGFMGSTPIVGGTVPLAAGAAWAAQLRATAQVGVVYFGDGCFEEGVVHETMNFAALHRLPIVFVCENNLYSVYTRLENRQASRGICDVAAAQGLHTESVDGNDVDAVYQVAQRAVSAARAGEGPQFIEAFTHRWLEHCGPNDDDDLDYRHTGELQAWLKRCPIERVAAQLWATDSASSASQKSAQRLEQQISNEIDAAFQFAEQAAPPVASVLTGVSTPSRAIATPPAERIIRYADAVGEGLAQAMAADPSVILVGEGVPDPKGIFGTSSGLQARFGPQRVFDSPLSENGVTGICIGAALNGLRPVMVHQRIDFALLAMDQLVNNAAKWHAMFNGRQRVPLVVRLIIGRGWGQGPQHGQNLQALFAHIPGLKVVMPSTAIDAKGMLIAAIADDDPVMFVEHRWLHGTRGVVPEAMYETGLDSARTLRHGTDVTIAAFSHMVIESLKCADWLAQQGVSAEVIDMRSVSPLDVDAVVDSVRRTGHLVVADTGHRRCGIGAGLLAETCVAALALLRKPPSLIALPDAPLPTSRYLADDYYPDAATLAIAALEQCDASGKAADAIVALRRDAPRDQPDPDFIGPF